MRFLWDLIRRIFRREPAQPVAEVKEEKTVSIRIEPPSKKKKSEEFDLTKEADPKLFLNELQSMKPIPENLQSAKEEILKELQRLAPPRRKRNQKDAA